MRPSDHGFLLLDCRSPQVERTTWVIVNILTKSSNFLVVKKTVRTDQLAHAYISDIMRCYGISNRFVSDRDASSYLYFREIFIRRLEQRSI